MSNESDNLEERCENAVFDVCCAREHYSVKCAEQMEKYLNLSTKIACAEVHTNPAPSFTLPEITEEEQKLFDMMPNNKSNQQTNSTDSVQGQANRLKELHKLVNLIKKEKKTEVFELLSNGIE